MKLSGEGFIYHFPDGFDDRAVVEMADKGYVAGGSVEIDGKSRYPVALFTPTRLGQELAIAVKQGESVLAEEALAVIPTVTTDAILRAVEELVRQRFFDHLRPLVPAEANGVVH